MIRPSHAWHRLGAARHGWGVDHGQGTRNRSLRLRREGAREPALAAGIGRARAGHRVRLSRRQGGAGAARLLSRLCHGRHRALRSRLERRGRWLRRRLHRYDERFRHERAPLRARHPGDWAGAGLLHDRAHARQPLLRRDPVGRLDPALQEGHAGIRRRRQARLHPLHQRDAGCREPARRQGGGGLPQAGGVRHALHRGGRRRGDPA